MKFFLLLFIFLKINQIIPSCVPVVSGISSLTVAFIFSKKYPKSVKKIPSFLKSNKVFYPYSFLSGFLLGKTYIWLTAKEIPCISDGLAYVQIHVDRHFYEQHLIKEKDFFFNQFKNASFFKRLKDEGTKKISLAFLQCQDNERDNSFSSNVAFKPIYRLSCNKKGHEKNFEDKNIEMVLYVFALPNFDDAKDSFKKKIKYGKFRKNKKERDQFLNDLNKYCEEEVIKKIDAAEKLRFSYFIIEEKRIKDDLDLESIFSQKQEENQYLYELNHSQLFEFSPQKECLPQEKNELKENRISSLEISQLKLFNL